MTCGKRKDNSLDPCLTNQLGGGEKTERGEKEEEESFRVRSSHFSLDFPVIGSSNSGKTRSKVDPHCKSYMWVPEVWTFDKLQEVGVFSYLDILCLKGHENGFGCCEAGMTMDFGSNSA